MRRVFLYRTLLSVWLFAVTVLSLIPAPEWAGDIPDKAMHYCVYLFTAFIAFTAYNKTDLQALFISNTGVFLYSLIIEVLQFFLPYRDFSVMDMMANAAGIITFTLIGAVYLVLFSPGRSGTSS